MSRDWLLYLDDLIASAEKIGRLTQARNLEALQGDEAAYDAVLFNLQIIGERLARLFASRSGLTFASTCANGESYSADSFASRAAPKSTAQRSSGRVKSSIAKTCARSACR